MRLTTRVNQGMSLCFTSLQLYHQKQQYGRQSFRSTEIVAQQKTKKPGRPKLPKGEAKGRIVNVRLAADHLKLVEAQAKAKKQTVSEWIRSTLNAAVQQ
jgi:predicted HicB family RNase H-like nuclease